MVGWLLYSLGCIWLVVAALAVLVLTVFWLFLALAVLALAAALAVVLWLLLALAVVHFGCC